MMNKISDDNYYNRPANVQFSFEFTKCTMAERIQLNISVMNCLKKRKRIPDLR